jgi:hypothetical protein
VKGEGAVREIDFTTDSEGKGRREPPFLFKNKGKGKGKIASRNDATTRRRDEIKILNPTS